MSFDLLAFDSDLFSGSDFVSSESEPHFDFFPFDDDDHHHHAIQQNPDEDFHFLNQAVTTPSPTPPHFHPTRIPSSSSSPPSNKMGYLSISPQIETTNNLQHVAPNVFVDFSAFDTDQCNDSIVFHGNVAQGLQRSYSSNCFSEETRISSQQPQLNTVMKSPSFFRNGFEDSSVKSFYSAQIKRVCSAGDIQEIKTPQTIQRSLMGRSLIEVNDFKVGKYSADERKVRIHKYRAKRSQRNFNKTIKYACRKTLADNRQRIRGRFARNDEIGNAPNTTIAVKDEDEDDDLWVDRLNGEEYEGTIRRGGQFEKKFGPSTLFQY